MLPKCSCIIPFYNEGERILNVVKSIQGIQNIHEIICVDDGSSDDSYKMIKEKYPNIRLIKNKKNEGKSDAIMRGLLTSIGDIIFMFDGDLKNIVPHEITSSISLFQKNKKIDMIIFKITGGNNLFDQIQRKEIIYGGNRLIRRNHLEEIIKTEPHKYRLEVAANKYMMMNKKNIFWIKLSAKNIHKSFKYGLITGFKQSMIMELDLFLFLGPLDYAKQVLSFCRKEIVI
jgi:glycosyltransferase involved in cell wall biosynthesis